MATSIGAAKGLAAQLRAAARPQLATSIGASISSIGAAPARLQGVDLRLDSFDLSEAKQVSPETQEGSWSGEFFSLDECTSVGNTFWCGLESDSKVFKEEDRVLLREVFNPQLSDRRSEGDLFVPPDASHTYVTKLRGLIKEEKSVRQRRKACFCAKTFSMDEPGSLFPFSWKSSFESSSRVEQGQNGALVARPEYKDQALEFLRDALQDSSPIFDKSTEDGQHFRIYSLGTLEVRTIQEADDEVVAAVFSICDSATTAEHGCAEVHDHEKVVKATQYVERAGTQWHYYAVLETENGHKILMESRAAGNVAWEPQPADLEDRNSLAKVIHSGVCRPGLHFGDMKAYQSNLDTTNSKHHAQSVFAHATGDLPPAPRPAASFCVPMMMVTPSMINKRIPFMPKKVGS